jgi:23S rRNA maturation mini-RNase III
MQSVILPEVANSIADEMLVIWQNGRNTRIYTETKENTSLARLLPYTNSVGAM